MNWFSLASMAFYGAVIASVLYAVVLVLQHLGRMYSGVGVLTTHLEKKDRDLFLLLTAARVHIADRRKTLELREYGKAVKRNVFQSIARVMRPWRGYSTLVADFDALVGGNVTAERVDRAKLLVLTMLAPQEEFEALGPVAKSTRSFLASMAFKIFTLKIMVPMLSMIGLVPPEGTPVDLKAGEVQQLLLLRLQAFSSK